MPWQQMEPIVVNALQLRLAIELAGAEAYRLELRRQLIAQTGRDVMVTATVDIKMTWPDDIEVYGRKVVHE